MREPHKKGVTNRLDFESCAGGGNAAGEALTEAHAGRVFNSEIIPSARRPYPDRGKATRKVTRNASRLSTPRSVRPREKRKTPYLPPPTGPSDAAAPVSKERGGLAAV